MTSGILSPGLHPCVRSRRWFKEGVLSFIPPDSAFDLATFQMSHKASGKTIAATVASNGLNAPSESSLPFSVKASRKSAKESKSSDWNFEIRLVAGSGRGSPACAEKIEVSFQVCTGFTTSSDQDAAEGPASVSVDARAAVSSRSALSSSGAVSAGDDAGVWRFDARKGLLTWSVPRLGSSGLGVPGPSEVVLKGSVSHGSSPSSAYRAKPSPVLTAFSYPLDVPSVSGLRVASLQLSGVDYKPFKGVRGNTSCRIEWRW